MDRTKQRIIASVFDKRNSSGQQESYVAHIKIFEDTEEGGRKPRYILLSQSSSGQGFIHKSKMNANGTFSVGKSWKLSELRGIEVVEPSLFNITLARTYRWTSDDPREQSEFISATVRTFRQLFGVSRSPLTLINVPEPAGSGANASSDGVSRRPTQSVNATISRDSPSVRRDPPAVNSRTTPQFPGAQSQMTSPAPTRSAFSSSIRPESTSSFRSSTSLPSVHNHKSTPPVSEMPPVARSSLEQNGRPSFETGRSSPSSERQAGATTPRSRRAQSPIIPSVSVSRSSTALSSTTSRARKTPSPVPVPALPPEPMPTPQSRRPPRIDPEDENQRSQPRNQPSSSQVAPGRNDPNARISFLDSSNQGSVDRLLTNANARKAPSSVFEEESAEATLANVEEMLEGYEWATENTLKAGSKRKRRAADQIEARLQDELMALEKANIYAFLEDDDRVSLVLKYIDDAVRELEGMDTFVSSYKIHLNTVSEDISYIQSQNRGLQVQTQNQTVLLAEIESLLKTLNVDREVLVILTQESLEKSNGIERLEAAAGELYKALLAGRDTEMAASMERLEEYRTYNGQFCKRLHDFLQIMFSVQARISDRTLTDKGRIPGEIRRHGDLESYLGRYSGLMLYLKEMGEDWYSKVCATYFSAASGLHNQEMKELSSFYASRVKKATEEELEMGFSPPQSNNRGEQLRRARSQRSPMDARKDRDKRSDNEMRPSEALDRILNQIGQQIFYEEQFIADFLQINEASLTFADYLNLDNYLRGQAARSAALGQSTSKLIRGAMDLIFGFLAGDLKSWIDTTLARDSIQIVGMLVALETAITEGEEKGMFWTKVLQKQHLRAKGLFERHIDEQIRAIEQAKQTTRKRKGIVHFIKYFPVYVGRIESQLIGADILDIRAMVDTAYEAIVPTMFETLKQIAKVQGEGEDKGQLNYHVELVENMHWFISEISQQDVGSVKMFVQRAQSLYDENLDAYVKLVLRRSLAKILDYFDGVERLLQSKPASEIANNSNYNKASLKRVVKEYNAKDIRRHIDSLNKRVEKHFAEPGEEHAGNSAAVVKAVWTACEQQLVKSTEKFMGLIGQCYKDTGVTLEYTVQDVETAFKKYRFGGSS